MSTVSQGPLIDKIQLTSVSDLITFTNKSILEYSAKTLVQVSEEVYKYTDGGQPADFDGWKVVNDNIRSGYDNEKRVVIYQNGDDYIIGFKGTDSFEDWLQDFSILPVPFTPTDDQGRIPGSYQTHKGFNELYTDNRKGDAIAQQLIQFIRNTTINKLYLTGHSLGGALAKLCLYDLMCSLKDHEMPELIGLTFAEPCISYKEDLAKYFEKLYQNLTGAGKKINYARMVIQHDLVPILLLPIGYHHGGETITISEGGPLEHSIAYHKLSVQHYFDRREAPFTVRKDGEDVYLEGGMLCANKKNIVDLISEVNNLTDVFPGITNINLQFKPGVIYGYDVVITGKSPYSLDEKILLTFYFEDGNKDKKRVYQGNQRTMSYNAEKPNIVKVKYEKIRTWKEEQGEVES